MAKLPDEYLMKKIKNMSPNDRGWIHPHSIIKLAGDDNLYVNSDATYLKDVMPPNLVKIAKTDNGIDVDISVITNKQINSGNKFVWTECDVEDLEQLNIDQHSLIQINNLEKDTPLELYIRARGNSTNSHELKIINNPIEELGLKFSNEGD